MRMPVLASMVRMRRAGPPKAYAALILVVPCPGIGTRESRGIDISRLGPEPVCSSMIVSVRWPAAPPVLSSLRSAGVRPARESLPTSRYVVPGWSPGRSPEGMASLTLVTWFQATSGVIVRNTRYSSRSSHT